MGFRSRLQGQFNDYNFRRRLSGKRVVYAASMPRSASTWVYNVILALLEFKYNEDVSASWHKDLSALELKKNVLVKIHQFKPSRILKNAPIIYSYRDVRDSFGSAVRKFNVPLDMAYPNRIIRDDLQWKAKATYSMRYEAFLKDPEIELMHIMKALNIKHPSPQDIFKIVEDRELSSKNQNETNAKSQFHGNHRTLGGSGTYHETLPQNLIQEIEKTHQDWFVANQYPI